MNAILPNKPEELKIDDNTFATIVEEVNIAALDIRPTRNKEGTVEQFVRHIESIVKNHGISYSDYCSDVAIRKGMNAK
jgi:hypothetical protein